MKMLRDGFLRFCDDPEIACCRAEAELGQLRIENAQLRAQLAELQELVKAKEEGRLVELPCKVGDTVYVAQPRRISELCVDPLHKEIITAKVIEFVLRDNGISVVRLFSDDDRIADYHYDYFCKTVFLTKDAAYKALGSDTP
jgi:hypothetical protein